MKKEATFSAVRKGKKLIPGLSQLLSKRPDMFSPDKWPSYFSKAKGVEVWDLDGNRYIDMSISGIGANILGYADADVDDAVVDSIRNGVSSSLNPFEDVLLAEKLLGIHLWADQVRFARCGGEAMSVAVRIARAATGKDKIAFCGYHGWHDWYLAANLGDANNLNPHLITGLSPIGVPKALAGTAIPFQFNDLVAFKEVIAQHGSELGAIVMEPMRNFKAPNEYWNVIEATSKELNIPLIIDEISMGFRLCNGGAHRVLGINPDIAVFSKAMANGYAMAAIIGKEEWMSKSQDSFISSTMWTERVGPTAALACINKYEQLNVEKHLAKIGSMVMNGWQSLAEKHSLNIHISGISALSHFTLECNNFPLIKAFFVEKMLEKGFLATNMFYVMYAHKEEHVVQYLNAVDDVFSMIKELLAENKMPAVTPVSTGFKRLN